MTVEAQQLFCAQLNTAFLVLIHILTQSLLVFQWSVNFQFVHICGQQALVNHFLMFIGNYAAQV